MRRLLVLSGALLACVAAMVSPAQASGRTLVCDEIVTGLTIKGHVVVPSGGSCTLVNSTVRGDVKVRRGGYFEANGTTIRGDVSAKRAQTVFLEGGSTVRGDVLADRTAQVFVFASRVSGEIDITRASNKVNVCGSTVRDSIEIARSGPDILVGDPLAVDCPGNVVKRGDIEVENNFTDIELVIRGNTITRGNLEVRRNAGPSEKVVQDNKGGRLLDCRGNGPSFTEAGNTGWRKKSGQCA